MTRALLIPAAGVGSRLRSTVPKALYTINDRPLLDYILTRYRALVDRVVLVVRPVDRPAFEAYLAALDPPLSAVTVVEQPEATGMLDAILLGGAALLGVAPAPDRLWITWCDQVAISPATVERLRAYSDAPDAEPLIFPTVRQARPYIHLVRTRGRITGIRHRREGDRMPPIGESDAGLFSLSREAYADLLPRFAGTVEPGAATHERNFLPFIPWLAARAPVRTFRCASPIEAVGVNTPEDAERVARQLRDA